MTLRKRKALPDTNGDGRAPQPPDVEEVEHRLTRQYIVAAAMFGLLIVVIIMLFGHLIAGTLSKQYLESTLVRGEDAAQRLADEITSDATEDMFEVVEKRRETLIRHKDQLARRQLFERLIVRDAEGNVVWEAEFTAKQHLTDAEMPDPMELGPGLRSETRDSERRYEVSVPVGDIGDVVLLLDEGELSERVSTLRRELLLKTLTTAVVTLIALVGAFALIWHLVQRNRRLEAQRHEARELADLGALAANLAHEIRNPLNSINLNLELLEEDLAGTDEDGRGSLEPTRREIGRLARLVSDFLTYARPTAPKTDQVPLASLFEDIQGFLRAETAARGVHLRVVKPDPRDAVRADAGQLRQVLLNLILNAAQAVENLEPERRVVELRAETGAEDGATHLCVRDRGNGVPANELGQIHRPFVTLRRGGTGLGLAIADRVARAHAGELRLRNLEPTGFEACLALPSGEDNGTICQSPGEQPPGT